MRPRAAIAILAATGLLAGCGGGLSVPGVPRAVGLADRCAAVLTVALPSDVDITSRTSANAGVDKIVAHVEATRSALPKDSPAAHDFAAECEFTDSTLSAFRWTKGGPGAPH